MQVNCMTTQNTLYKEIFKDTILVDDVVDLITSFVGADEPFNIKNLMREYFNYRPKDQRELGYKINDWSEAYTIGRSNILQQYEDGERSFLLYKMFLGLVKTKNHVKLSSIRESYMNRHNWIRIGWRNNPQYIDQNYYRAMQRNKGYYSQKQLDISNIVREIVDFKQEGRIKYISKEKYKAIDWVKLDQLIMYYLQLRQE